MESLECPNALAKQVHALCEANGAAAEVLDFLMSGRVRMMTCSFGRCSGHSGLANPTIR